MGEISNGKSVYRLEIRITKDQQLRLRTLAEAEGCKTVAEFVRKKVFDNISIHHKLNEILILLHEEEEKPRKTKSK